MPEETFGGTDQDESVAVVPGGQTRDTPSELADISLLFSGPCSARVNEDSVCKAVHPRDGGLLQQCCSSLFVSEAQCRTRAFNHD